VFATDYAEVRLPLTDRDLGFVDLPGVADVSSTGSADGPAVRLSAVQKGERTTWTANIVRSEGVVDEKSRVTYAVARIEDPYCRRTSCNALPVGTFVSAAISGTSAKDVIQVPRAVIRGSDELLFVDDDNTLRIRKVDIVRSDSQYIYVGGGAVPGERISITALETPVNGMSVRTSDQANDSTEPTTTASE